MPIHGASTMRAGWRVGKVEGLLAEGVSPNSTDSDGVPAVRAAAFYGHTAVLECCWARRGWPSTARTRAWRDRAHGRQWEGERGACSCSSAAARTGAPGQDGGTALDEAEEAGHPRSRPCCAPPPAQPQAGAPAAPPGPLATLTAVGFPEDDCAVLVDDLDRAIRYLTEGIPDDPPPQAPARAPAPAPHPPTPAAPSRRPPTSRRVIPTRPGSPPSRSACSRSVPAPLGATADQMDAVDDDDSRAAVVALLSLRSALEAAKVSELKRLRTLGAADDQMDEVDDAPD